MARADKPKDVVLARKRALQDTRIVISNTRIAKKRATTGDCDGAYAALDTAQFFVSSVKKLHKRAMRYGITHKTVARLERLYGRTATKVREYCPR